MDVLGSGAHEDQFNDVFYLYGDEWEAVGKVRTTSARHSLSCLQPTQDAPRSSFGDMGDNI